MSRSHRFSIALSALCLLASSTAVRAERTHTDPTGWYWLYGVTPAAVAEIADDFDMRLIDVEVDSASPLRLNAAFVRNAGVHQTGWWWYYGLDAAGVSERLAANQARLIDLETYTVDGEQRFACVMVPNSGPSAKTWGWLYNVSAETIGQYCDRNRMRVIDLETYRLSNRAGAERLFSAVMIRNEGEDASGWWWYWGATGAQVSDLLAEHGARILDVDPYFEGGELRFAVVLLPNVGPGSVRWWWYYGVDASRLVELYEQNGARIADIESYTVGGERRFAVMMLNNSNALTSRIASILGYGSNGSTGLYLHDVDGPTYAALQIDKQFETASSIKVLHLLHAVLQVQEDDAELGEQIPWCSVSSNATSPKDGCPNAPCGETVSLQWAITRMMQNSDNRTTDAVRRRFGFDAINGTRAALGMDDSILQHVIGCGTQILDDPNLLTLRDAGMLYGRVAEGTVLDGFHQEVFWGAMLNETNAGMIGQLRTIAEQEGASLGMSAAQIDAFVDEIRLAYKGGSYDWAGLAYRSVCGWVRMPRCTGGGVEERDYVFGLFAHEATDGDAASAAQSTARGELFRERLRDHLASFAGPAACVPVAAPRFVRGDANGDLRIDIADGSAVLNFLFLGGDDLPCDDAADANDDGSVDIGDGIKILNVLFLGDSFPRGTVFGEPEEDRTEDRLGCESYPRVRA